MTDQSDTLALTIAEPATPAVDTLGVSTMTDTIAAPAISTALPEPATVSQDQAAAISVSEPHAANPRPTLNNYNDPIARLRLLQGDKRAGRSAIEIAVQSAFFGTDRDKELESAADGLVDNLLRGLDAAESDEFNAHGRLCEGRALVLIGGSGAGKSRSLQRLFARKPEFTTDDGKPSPLLLSVMAPAPCTMRILAKTINTGTGYHSHRDPKESEAWDLMRHNIELRGIRFLHIDEFQHTLQSRNPVEIQKIRDALKGLMQNPRWPVHLILSGLPEIATFIEGDTQIWRRCTFVRFDPLDFARDAPLVKRMLAFYGRDKGKLTLGAIRSDEFVARLMHASLSEFGLTVEFIQDAIGQALKANSASLEPMHFARAYAVRTGCPEGLNIFTVEGDWTQIDARAALFPMADEAEDEIEPKPSRKAGKQRGRKTGNPRTK